jgi:hypothetical protein
MIRWEAVSLFAAALVVGALGALHLAYTFFGRKLQPRDADLMRRMTEDSPGISRATTMWKAWVGFNASHAMGAMLFGLVYGWIAMRPGDLFLGSGFLATVGLLFLLGLAVLARRYWFRIPFAGVLLALALYTYAAWAAWR